MADYVKKKIKSIGQGSPNPPSNRGYDNSGHGSQVPQHQGYTDLSYGNAGYADQSYGNQGHTGQDYGNQGYAPNDYGNQGYAASDYGNQGHGGTSYYNQGQPHGSTGFIQTVPVYGNHAPQKLSKDDRKKNDLKEEIKNLKEDIKTLQKSQDAWRCEEDGIRSYLKSVGVRDTNTRLNAGDLLKTHCNLMINHRNTAEKNLKDKIKDLQIESSERGRLQSELNLANRDISNYNETIEKLERRLEGIDEKHKLDVLAATNDLQTKLATVESKYEARLSEQTATYEAKLNDLRRSYDAQLADAHQRYDRDMKRRGDEYVQNDGKWLDKYTKAMSGWEAKHDTELATLLEIQDKETLSLKEHIKDLEADLLSQTDDFRPATDQALKLKFTTLKQEINAVTFSKNLNMVPNATLDHTFDQTGFLARPGQGKLQFMLRSLFWEVLFDHFFATPFGFGFLGKSGKGQESLRSIHTAWLSIYHVGKYSYDPATRNEMGNLAVFTDDYQANKFRSALFQSLTTVIRAHGDKHGGPSEADDILKYYWDARRSAEIRLENIIGQVTEFPMLPNIKQKISKIAGLASELGLELGVQRAQLRLSSVLPKTRIRIGDEFQDCQEGAKYKGQSVEVALLVSPALSKMGDGRGDVKSKRVLVPGEIYPTSYPEQPHY